MHNDFRVRIFSFTFPACGLVLVDSEFIANSKYSVRVNVNLNSMHCIATQSDC